MPRPDPWRLDPAAYPYSDTIQTRFADLDVLGHINNVAMVALFETGRTRFNHAAGLTKWRKPRWLVAAQEVNYLAEGNYPADVTMTHGIGRIGEPVVDHPRRGVSGRQRHRDRRRDRGHRRA